MGPRLVQYSDVENAHDDPDRVARLAGTLQALAGPETLVVGTGDNTAPGVLSLVTEGRQALDLFDAVEPDFETFGNHDFDHGIDAARAIVDASPQTWLTANVGQNGARFAAETTERMALREVGGVQIGLVGVTAPSTGETNPDAAPLSFSDPIAAVEDASATLRERGADLIVVLAHLGQGVDDLARTCDADVILDGHVHERRADRVGGTLVTRPGSDGDTVVTVDLDGDRPTASFRVVDDGPADSAVATAIEGRLAEAGLDEVVGRVDDPITRTRADTLRGESRIGNFVADAYRWATGADVGLQNAGGVRSNETPLAGDVTVADLVSVVPFEERVAVVELTGAELRTLCRQAAGSTVEFGEPDWWHAHFSGVEVVWNREHGRVEQLQVGGEPVRDDAAYTLATTNYLLQTPTEFPVLNESHRSGLDDIQYEVLADYARSVGIDPAVEGRVRRR